MVASQYIVFPEAQKIDVWQEDIPDPAPGQVLCKAQKSLISIGTEMHCLNGIFGEGTNWSEWVEYPFRPGYSMVGEVIAVGEGVTSLKLGNRIATGDKHQQYYLVDIFDPQKEAETPKSRGPYVVPDDISSEEATWRSLANTTQNAVRRGNIVFGESVGVVGLGILGQLTTQYLAAAGAKTIIAIDRAPSRLELAKNNGATHTLEMNVEDAVKAVTEITEGWMLDAVFDVTGLPQTLAPSILLSRELGRVILLGDTPTPRQQHLGPGVVSNAVAILGIHGYTLPAHRTSFTPWTAREMSSVFFNYLQRGKMNVKNLVTHRISPLEAPAIYQALRKDRSDYLGIIIDWTQ